MKGKSKIKQTTVLLIAYVLVVGFVGLGGQVYGQEPDGSEDSDVTVTSQELVIDIWNVWINATDEDENNHIVDEGEHTTATIDNPEAVSEIDVEVRVQIDTDVSDLEEVNLWLNSTYDTSGVGGTDDGDARRQFIHTWTTFDTGTSEILEVSWTDGDIDHFLRYGDWGIAANVHEQDEEGGRRYADDEIADTEPAFDVSSYSVIDVTEADGTATVEPGTTASGEDFGSPVILISANFEWNLEMSGYTLYHEDDAEESTLEGEADDQGYGGDSTFLSGEEPAVSAEHDVYYEVDVPEGTPPGEYSTQHNDEGTRDEPYDPATHTIYINDGVE